MAAQPTFEYDYLRKLLREHGDKWSLSQYAKAVTDHEREVRRDPHYGPISPSAIGSAKNRYRDAWAELGVSAPPLKRAPVRSQPFANVPKDYWNNYLIEALRTLTRIERGDPDILQVRRTTAVNLAAKLREARQVIDLRPSGQPYVRAARPDELDGEGHIFQYNARYPGLTDAQWTRMGTAEMRAAAADRFLTDHTVPVKLGKVS